MDFQLNLGAETIAQMDVDDPIRMTPEQSVRETMQAMKARQQGKALICQDDVLVGVFTERDALKYLAAESDPDAAVENAMTRSPQVVTPQTTVGEAAALMAAGGYRRLPVVEDSGRPVGVLSVSHVLHYIVQHFPAAVYTLPPEPQQVAKEREGA